MQLVLLGIILVGMCCTQTISQDDDDMLSAFHLTSGNSKQGKCEDMQTDMLNICTNIAYNQTYYPNVLKHQSQIEALRELTMYQPLIRINCSPQIKLFLCSLYAPPCIRNYTQSIVKPCRELCEQARSGCELIMKSFKYEWAEDLNCARFPLYNRYSLYLLLR
jgi:hypothetical protein